MAMPQISLNIDEVLLKRIEEFAAANSCSLEEMVLRMLLHSIEMHDSVTSPEYLRKRQEEEEEYQKLLARRPKIDRAKLQAMVDNAKAMADEAKAIADKHKRTQD